ncbi:protein of unknown function [Tepidibacter aestuarii]|nr:protein of unknown function [Tepidibacter aestuarii]
MILYRLSRLYMKIMRIHERYFDTLYFGLIIYCTLEKIDMYICMN